MQWRALTAVCLVFSLISSVGAQDATALDAIFRQAAERESGSAKDYASASRLYAEAARQGHTPSMVRLGYLKQSGTGVPPDLSGALGLFTQAAEAGNLDGQFMLGITYLQGIGTAKDPATARDWLLKAAGKEHQYAQYLIGMMLESGEGGPRREAGARWWLDRASEGPDRNLAVRAASMRDKIDKNMLAPDNSAGLFVTALLFMALVGTVMQGGVDSGAIVPAMLVISSNYYPGWTATVNGEPARIFCTNYTSMGVLVPQGRSDVVLEFVTPGFRLGAIISVLSIGLCAVGLFLPWVRQKLPARNAKLVATL